MPTKQSLNGVKERIFIHHMLSASLAGLAVFLLGFTLIPALIAEASATTNASIETSWESLSLTLDPDYAATQAGGSITDVGHGDIDFGEVTPTGKDVSTSTYGTQKVAKKTIRVVTSGKHYAVYLSVGKTATTNALKITAEDSDQTIAAISDGASQASFDATQSFTRTGWGYAVPSTSITGADFATVSTYTAYDNNLAGSVDDNLTKTGTGSAFYNTGTWAAVPLYANAQQIYKNSNESRFNSGDTFDIYYSVMVDTDVMAGTYKNEILYTAMASTTDIDAASNNMSRSIEYVASGTTETIKIDLVTAPNDLGNGDIKIFLVPHGDVVTSNYTKPNLTISQAVSNYAQCVVQTVTSTNATATITCNMPTVNGTTVQIANNTATQNGEYDLWAHVDTTGLKNVDYISHYTDSDTGADIASVVYAGLQSKHSIDDGEGGTTIEPYITEMQQMNKNICQNTNIWNDRTGVNARIFDYRGMNSGSRLVDDILDENDNVDETATLAANAALGIGSFKLLDNRDNKPYLVRRLADGNCWMVQNLGLELSNFIGEKTGQSGALTSSNTDLSKDYWDPSETTLEKALTFDISATTSNYFSIASTNLLGTNQGENQFLPKGSVSSTYHFVSLYNEAGERLDSTCSNATSGYDVWSQQGLCYENNSRAEIPRSYSNEYDYIGGTSISGESYSSGTDSVWDANHAGSYIGNYYNYYAATAESGHFDTPSETGAEDSICPKGWSLPNIGGSQVNKSWANILNGTYKDANGVALGSNKAASVIAMQEIPLSLALTGNYDARGFINYLNTYGRYFSGGTKTIYRYIYYLHFGQNDAYAPQGSMNQLAGMTIRCVARD